MPPWSRLPILGKFGVVLVALVGVYALLGAVLLPWWVAREFRSQILEVPGIEGDVVDVDFNPFTLVLEIEALAVDAPGYTSAGSLDALYVDVAVAPLLRGAIVFETIRLVGPRVLIDIDREGVLHVAGVGLGGDEDSENADAEESGGGVLPEIVIQAFEIENGRLEFHDHTVATDADPKRKIELHAEPISFRISDFRASAPVDELKDVARAGGDAEISFETPNGGKAEARGVLRIEPVFLDLEVSVDELSVVFLEPYLHQLAKLDIASGALSLQGQLHYDATSADGLRYDGEVHLTEMELRKAGEADAPIGWAAFDLAGVDLDMGSNQLQIEELALREPRVALVRNADGSLDVSQLAVASDPQEVPRSGNPSPDDAGIEFTVAIERTIVEDGSVALLDRAVSPAAKLRLTAVKLDAGSFATTPGTRTDVDLSLRVNDSAPLSVRGDLEPMSPVDYSKLAIRLSSLALYSFSPYVAPALGKPIDQGKLGAELDVAIERGNVVGKNRFFVDRLEFGPAIESDEATKLPVAMAVDLLKDADQRIEVNLPVNGSLNDPGFSYRGALLNGLRQLVTKVVASPFGAIAGLANIGTDELKQVGFAPGKYEIDEAESEKLAVVAEALKSRPQLRIEVRGMADALRDGPAVRKLPFGKASAEALETLAEQRSQQIRMALVDVGGVEGERVFVRKAGVVHQEREALEVPASSEDDRIYSELSLEGASRIPTL